MIFYSLVITFTHVTLAISIILEAGSRYSRTKYSSFRERRSSCSFLLSTATKDINNNIKSLPFWKDSSATLGKFCRNDELKPLAICKLVYGLGRDVSFGCSSGGTKESTVAQMTQLASEGLTTFDLTTVAPVTTIAAVRDDSDNEYDDSDDEDSIESHLMETEATTLWTEIAEEQVGRFSRGSLAAPTLAAQCQFLTSWSPSPDEFARTGISGSGHINRKDTNAYVAESMRRMKSDRIDLLQFFWSDYSNKYYYDAMDHLMALQQEGQVLQLGLVQCGTIHMLDLLQQGAPIVSNQVSLSVLDTRALYSMSSAAHQYGVHLLCTGTLMGGFLGSYWLGKREPDFSYSNYASSSSSYLEATGASRDEELRRYFPMILQWGGWELFQELLRVLSIIADKHSVSLTNIAQRWVLDQQAVGGIIVTAAEGDISGSGGGGGGGGGNYVSDTVRTKQCAEYIREQKRVFEFGLDEEDRAVIEAVQNKARKWRIKNDMQTMTIDNEF